MIGESVSSSPLTSSNKSSSSSDVSSPSDAVSSLVSEGSATMCAGGSSRKHKTEPFSNRVTRRRGRDTCRTAAPARAGRDGVRGPRCEGGQRRRAVNAGSGPRPAANMRCRRLDELDSRRDPCGVDDGHILREGDGTASGETTGNAAAALPPSSLADAPADASIDPAIVMR